MAVDILTLALAKKMSGASGGGAVQSDWNANEGEPGYVLNRTHYKEEGVETLILIETEEQARSALSAWTDNAELKVNIEGTDYTNFKYTSEMNGPTTYLHTLETLDGLYRLCVSDRGGFWFEPRDVEPRDVVWRRYEIKTRINQLDEIYIPDSIARTENVMSIENPVCVGSFSKSRRPNTSVGNFSVTLGVNCEASGNASYAEGSETTASGYNSHAEGLFTKAMGYCSHAEGNHTIASGSAQHTQGRYNIEDTNDVYIHIVGNGSSSSKRSNAHTLDWNGVGWYQGGLQVGGNAQDDGAKNVLLEGDAIPVPTTASVGQIIVVKAVDDNGKPTEWESIDPWVINSSTEGSTKKFKITVDDNGTITATEVT